MQGKFGELPQKAINKAIHFVTTGLNALQKPFLAKICNFICRNVLQEGCSEDMQEGVTFSPAYPECNRRKRSRRHHSPTLPLTHSPTHPLSFPAHIPQLQFGHGPIVRTGYYWSTTSLPLHLCGQSKNISRISKKLLVFWKKSGIIPTLYSRSTEGGQSARPSRE